MINYLNIVDAVNRINGHRDGVEFSTSEKQLVNSLKVYQSRGEFNGTISSAIECLKQAGYELTSECLSLRGAE